MNPNGMEEGFGLKVHPDLKEECGVFGVFGHRDAPRLVYLGLTSLQHRGQESAGIASFNDKINRRAGMGLVFDVFKKEHFNFLKGHFAVGHVRYSTTGSSNLKNAQPLLVGTPYGQIALGHNGNLTNADSIRSKLESSGAIFQTTTDSEVILHLVARSGKKNLPEAIISALGKVEGAYSLLFGSEFDSKGKKDGSIIGIRDPYGFRPLILGKLNSSWILSSETCAFDLIGAKMEREIEPGEMVIIEKNRPPRFIQITKKSFPRKAFCIFEYIYFARPDSTIFGQSVYDVRREFGRQLAREAPAPKADCVIAVPDSALVAAIGYSEESKLPFEIGFIRSHYVGRTFIEPSKPLRDFRARVKYNPIRQNLKGKRIVLVDDSIVRGTTSRKLIRMLKAAGVKEIHMRISSPPIVGSCFYGIDTPTREELIAFSHSTEEIRKYLGVQSLSYLSVPGLLKAARGSDAKYCVGCFTGKYVTKVHDSRKREAK